MKLQMDENPNECWDILNNGSIKDALPSEAGQDMAACVVIVIYHTSVCWKRAVQLTLVQNL